MDLETKKNVIITGVSRGIGKETIRLLAERSDLQVFGTIRGESQSLPSLELSVPDSIRAFLGSDKLPSPIDVLIQNAAIYSASDSMEIRRLFQVNVKAPVMLFHGLENRFSDHPRIVHISSGMGSLSGLSREDREVLNDPALTESDLLNWMEQRIESIPGGSYPYSLSKAILNALTRIWHREFGNEMCIVSVCPGWVRTDMGGAGAPRSVSQGAQTPVWAATAPRIECGCFYRDQNKISW